MSEQILSMEDVAYQYWTRVAETTFHKAIHRLQECDAIPLSSWYDWMHQTSQIALTDAHVLDAVCFFLPPEVQALFQQFLAVRWQLYCRTPPVEG